MRQSLGETLNNLENHEIQLALAMQDLMVATSEIKKAAKIREQLNQLESCSAKRAVGPSPDWPVTAVQLKTLLCSALTGTQRPCCQQWT